MVRFSNIIIVFANTVLLILGLAALGFGITFVHGNSNCQKVLTDPLLILGAFLVAVSLLGLVGSLFRSNVLMFIYLTVMFLLIVGLLAFTVFAFLVTNPIAGKVFSDRGYYKEHRTGDFSNWLQNHFVNDKHWGKIKSCLLDTNLCGTSRDTDHVDSKPFIFLKMIDPALKEACCRPPSECGFKSKNETFWEVSGPTNKNPDCRTWSNDRSELCYGCNSCKAGFLSSIKKDWRSLATFNIVLIIILILVYSFGCCARKGNNKDIKKYNRDYSYA